MAVEHTQWALGRSLLDGWIPLCVQVVTLVALGYAIGWRTRRWRRVWLPATLAFGVSITLVARWWLVDAGLAGDPAPWSVWVWTTMSGLAVGVAVLGWRGIGWWRRNASVFAASFALLGTGLAINGWIGYYPTVGAAWGQLASRPPPGRAELAAAMAMRARGEHPANGVVVPVATGQAASGFTHRGEWVYLPPAWFDGDRLPAVMMIGGEFTTPADWIWSGDALATANAYAAAHDGLAPILVFVDPSGSFAVDTECVNGIRGRSADHLVMDVLPYVEATFGVGGRWGVVGFSSGGTCALDLAVMHSDEFSAFVDVAGDARPNTGTDEQTIGRLFGGDREAWSAFDPAAAITRHGPYDGLAGTFVVPEASQRDSDTANRMCTLGAAHGIRCRVVGMPGRHDWPLAANAFTETLPWLVGSISR